MIGSESTEPANITIELTIRRVGEVYEVSLAHTDPMSQARVAPVRGTLAYAPEALRARQATPDAYGVALAQQVFADDTIRQRFLQVEAHTQATEVSLRLCICLDPTAQELHTLRWECLRHPETHAPLATSERVLFSRFLLSADSRRIRLRARGQLVALIAVAAPVGPLFTRSGLAAVDGEGEIRRVQAALGAMAVRTIGGPGEPLTLDRLVGELRTGVDVLYLVSHGVFLRSSGKPMLYLQDEAGDLAVVPGEALAERVAELPACPRLVVLASCQSAGDGESIERETTAPSARSSVQATLAGRLADAGVPAIVAMQGNITMATVERLMPVFFTELLRAGQVDRAMAVARGAVRARPDHWMPALYTRLDNGLLWYTPGFWGGDETSIWQKLLKPVQSGKLVPILGPGILDTTCGDSFSVARTLAQHHRFPLATHDWDDMPRVSQYLLVKESRFNVVKTYQEQLIAEIIAQHGHWLPAEDLPPLANPPDLGRLLRLVADHLRATRPADVHRLLAELPASTYVTTNYDPLLEWALKAKQRTPRQVLSRWRHRLPPEPPPDPPIGEVSTGAPLVFHTFGAFGEDDSLVLTEDDFFDYLIGTTADRLIPTEVESALVDNSLLFLGFRLTDWRFRVLFRLMRNLPGKERLQRYCHVAVQLDPELQTMADVEGAKQYLKKYFHDEAQIEIYFGSAEDFLTSLRDALAKAGGPSPAPAAKGKRNAFAI